MSRTVKIVLVSSLLLNLIFLILAGVFVQRRGGMSYIYEKFGYCTSQKPAAAVSPVYRDYVSVQAILPVNSKSILFIGDSITQDCLWTELLGNLNVKHRGVDGDTLTGMLARIDKLAEAKPAKIFLMAGIVDLMNGRDIPSIAKDYEKILVRIRKISPNTTVYVQSVLPVNSTLDKRIGVGNNDIAALNKGIEGLAKSLNMTYLDLYSSFLKDGQLNPDYSYDGLYLSGRGYLAWKKLIEKYI